MSIALLFPLCLWAGFTTVQSVNNGHAFASTRAMIADNAIFEAYERKQYINDLYDLVSSDPDTFTQLIGSDFLAMFNEPELIRREGNISVWQYRSEICVLDIFFNEDFAAAHHYDLRPRHTAYIDQDAEQSLTLAAFNNGACLKSIMAL